MTRKRIRRGAFRSIVDLQSAINAYLAEGNAHPKAVCLDPIRKMPSSPKLDRLPELSECV
jgi:hypothetical protein